MLKMILIDTEHAYSCTNCKATIRCSHDWAYETWACKPDCGPCSQLFYPYLGRTNIRLVGPPMLGAIYNRRLTPALEQARVWISECVWADVDGPDIPRLSDRQVYAGINRHYAGGWAQFVSDGE